MENPVYDLVIGNIEGVRLTNDPDIDWHYETRCLQSKQVDGVMDH